MGQPSPIRDITEKQAKLLRDQLREMDPDHEYHTFIAMRYWHPLTKETVEQISTVGVDRLIQLPLYPHYSKTTTGSNINEWNRRTKGTEIADIPTNFIKSYHDYEPYTNAVVKAIERTVEACCDSSSQLHLLFSAHGVPLKVIRNGDPYQEHIESTVNNVMEQLPTSYPHHLSYQSKVGPQKWLQPSTVDTLERLGAEGVKHLLVIPIAFVSDHSETLYELDIQNREIAEEAGITSYHVMPALNESPEFIEALAKRVLVEVFPNGKKN
jgi:ferrochelatase